jgi:hypothetical protein
MSVLDSIPGLNKLPPGAGEIVTSLLGIIFDLLRKGGSDEAQEEALMQAGEEAKRLLDKRKFG